MFTNVTVQQAMITMYSNCRIYFVLFLYFLFSVSACCLFAFFLVVVVSFSQFLLVPIV